MNDHPKHLHLTFSKEETDETHGRYVGTLPGHNEKAVIRFTRRHEDLISADHVETPVDWRGQGIAFALVEHMIADARENDFRIIPKCPYIMKQYDLHPEWSDVFTNKPHKS